MSCASDFLPAPSGPAATFGLTPSLRPVRVRGIESLGLPVARASGVARVALNLRGADLASGALARGRALVEAGRWTLTDVVDARLSRPDGPACCAADPPRLPRELTLHIGSARTVTRLRVLGGAIARLTCTSRCHCTWATRPLRDPAPPAGGHPRRGGDHPPCGTAAAGRPWRCRRGGSELGGWPERPAAADLLRRHGLLRGADLHAMGLAELPYPVAAERLADPARRPTWSGASPRRSPPMPPPYCLRRACRPRQPGPRSARRTAPGRGARRPPLVVSDGMTRSRTGPGGRLARACRSRWRRRCGHCAPICAPRRSVRRRPAGPEARSRRPVDRRGAARRAAAAGQRPDRARPRRRGLAARVLARLPQPFTTAQARQALGTTRRVAIPLLEYLDAAGATERLPDDRRRLRARPASVADPGIDHLAT